MKKAAILTALLCLMAVAVSAQERRIQIGASYGFQFGGHINGYNGYTDIIDKANYTGMIDFRIKPNIEAELSFSIQPTEVEINAISYAYYPFRISASVEYYQAGVLYLLKTGKVEPFTMMTLGAAHLNPDKYEDVWRFAIAPGIGVKIWLSENVGIRIQGRVLLPLYFAGGGVFVGTGGASMGVSAGVVGAQGDISGGLMIAF